MPYPRLVEKFLLGTFRYIGSRVASRLPMGWLRWLGSRSVVRALLRRLRINSVLDVGANRGQFGAMLRQVGHRGWILSFEPVRANLAILEKVAAAAPPWRVFPFALGASEGQQTINVTDETVFSSFLNPSQESQIRFPRNVVAAIEEVSVRRLEGVFAHLRRGSRHREFT